MNFKTILNQSMMMTLTALLSVSTTLWFASCKQQFPNGYQKTQPKHVMTLKKSSFNQLPGWQQDNLGDALIAFQNSCHELINRPPQAQIAHNATMGTMQDWRPVCKKALAMNIDPKNINAKTARKLHIFFERWFKPVAVYDNGQREGLFTGYFEGFIHGSMKKHGRYTIPIYRRPDDLITISLGDFDSKYKGRTLIGRVLHHHMVPYLKRKQINAGALAGRGLELLWVDSQIDRFFLEIQGSGRVLLDNGKTMHLLYNGQNGARYVAIARLLVKRGDISKENVSMQKIRVWLKANPKKSEKLFNENPSFIFFRLSANEPIRGSENIPLTAKRTLAVDKHYLALGAPIWLSTQVPNVARPKYTHQFQHLMVAQDTGGAIKGPVRGDIFWGYGKDAQTQAGYMKQQGQYWVLLPKTVVNKYFKHGKQIVI